MAFTFRYTELRYGQSDWTGPEGFTIFGELVSGEMALGEKIMVPLRSGRQFEGEIIRFTESIEEWLGLPFYDKLSTSSLGVPFCGHVYRRPEADDIVVPAVASFSEGPANLFIAFPAHTGAPAGARRRDRYSHRAVRESTARCGRARLAV